MLAAGYFIYSFTLTIPEKVVIIKAHSQLLIGESTMFKKKVDEQFLMISKEHTLIIDHLDRLENMLKDGISEKVLAELNQFLPTFEKDIREHFLLEEEVLFPAAISCLSTLELIDCVLILQKEHGYFERDWTYISQVIRSRSDPVPEDLLDRLKTYIDGMRQHACVEMEQVISDMDKSKRCQKLIKGLTTPI